MITGENLLDHIVSLIDGDYDDGLEVFIDASLQANGAAKVTLMNPDTEETQSFTLSVTPA